MQQGLLLTRAIYLPGGGLQMIWIAADRKRPGIGRPAQQMSSGRDLRVA